MIGIAPAVSSGGRTYRCHRSERRAEHHGAMANEGLFSGPWVNRWERSTIANGYALSACVRWRWLQQELEGCKRRQRVPF